MAGIAEGKYLQTPMWFRLVGEAWALQEHNAAGASGKKADLGQGGCRQGQGNVPAHGQPGTFPTLAAEPGGR